MREENPNQEIAAKHPSSLNRLPPWSLAVLVSALAWMVIFLAIPPANQDFPLGDDWAFARSAIAFAHGQGIHYFDWASMPQLGQWLWSWPFLHLLDLPHVALRVSVIVLSWLGLVAFYDLLRRAEVLPRTAAFATCVLALNPLFFISQGTYMTDVPALSFGLAALSLYATALERSSVGWMLAAGAMAVLAVVTRQTMLAVPVVAGFLLLRNRGLRWKPVWLLSVLLPVAACLFTARWFSQRADVLPMEPSLRLASLLFRPFLAMHLCGLVVLPLWLAAPRPTNWKAFRAGLALMICAAGGYYVFDQRLPYGGMFPYTTGMLSLCGTYSEGLVVGHREILLTPAVRLILTVLGCLGAAGMGAAMVESFPRKRLLDSLLLFTLLQFCIVLVLPTMMDRYLEVLFPGAILLVAMRGPASIAKGLGEAAALVLSGLVSVALMHDWLAWNSARWALGRQAIATSILKPDDIEGGFEWNGWFSCANLNELPTAQQSSRFAANADSLTLPFSRNFFPQVKGHFALAFTQPTNSVVVASLPYSVWLPPGQRDFLLVQAASPK